MKSVMKCAIMALALAMATASIGHAQGFPSRPVRVIVPFTPGGGSDSLTRIVADKLRESFAQSFVVENKPGADAGIGLGFVAKSPPDGYTLALATTSLSIHQALGDRSFDAFRDFATVSLLGTSPTILAGSASFPVKSIEQLIAYARANPGRVTYASCGSGSPQHLAGELLNQTARVKLVHVPYKGCSEAIPPVLSGEVNVLMNTVGNVAPHIKAGRIHAYATTGARRSKFALDVPTIAESGIAGYDLDNWYGWVAPAGTPQPVISRLNAEINKALLRGDVREKFEAMKYEPRGGTPEEFSALIRADVERFGAILQTIRMNAD